MTFTTANVGRMAEQLKRAAGALLTPQDVDLYQPPVDGQPQPPVTIQPKLHVGTRRANESDLTAGATVESGPIATIDAAHWDALAPDRPPQRGDVVHWAGRRYAIRDVHVSAPAGVRAFYKARLEG
ncbi:MAG: hypothetical protein ABJQ23_19965 [Shimia thalassica]|uniref:hypothetical protein n=1 Tax=Pseudomonadota TaxID=1224 RepID=UPI003297DD1B